jgi:hypothetical protein
LKGVRSLVEFVRHLEKLHSITFVYHYPRQSPKSLGVITHVLDLI